MNDKASQQRAEAEVNRQLEGATGQFIDRLADRLGARATAAAVYGEPVERDGVTVIPVAKVRWLFGGGSGRGRNNAGRTDQGEGVSEGSGDGGGGGAAVSPLGYIEIANGRAEFRRIRDASTLLPFVPILLAAGFSVLLILTGVRRLIANT